VHFVETRGQRLPKVSEFNPVRVRPVGVLPLPGFEPQTLRSPARCHDHKAISFDNGISFLKDDLAQA